MLTKNPNLKYEKENEQSNAFSISIYHTSAYV